MTEHVNPLITVTILDEASVFEGPDTVYRYDITGRTLKDGSALEAAMERIESLALGQWPCAVEVVVDPSATADAHSGATVLIRQLEVAGATVVGSEGLGAAEGLGEGMGVDTDSFPALKPEADEAEEPAVRIIDKPVKKRRVEPFHVVLGAVVVGLAGVSMWLVSRDTGEQVEAAPEPFAATSTTGAPSGTSAPGTSAAASSTVSAAPEEKGVEMRIADLTVTLPPGFSTTDREDGLITATGEDPNLRVLFAADPLFSVPASALFAEIRANVEEDPELSNAEEEDGRLSYLELPGDDSQVAWTTWVEHGHQVSVGCHSRSEPTTAQKAACRLAVDTVSWADVEN